MAEVLRRGRSSPPSVDVNCAKCDSLVRYGRSEGRRVPDNRDGDAYVFTCPECNHDNWVSAGIVEGWVRTRE